MAKITPMMEQYFQIKNEYKYCLLFFRLGDFYEMFFDDAIIASKELEITLTGRDWGQSERAPMCGVPFHSAESYINRLVEKGYKVAICEQLEDPKAAKGIVKRDVVRVITPGTITDNAALDEKKNNYIMSVFADKNGYGIAVCDVTTGEFITTEFSSVNAEAKVIDEIGHYMPSEIVTNHALKNSHLFETITKRFNISLSYCDDWTFSPSSARERIFSHLKIATLDGIGIGDKPLCVSACGGLLQYLYDTQKSDLNHITAIKYYSYSNYMLLDISTRRNLELVETMREKNRKGSLLWVLDKTKTAMGARLLKKWIEQPLMDKAEINKRLDSVGELKDDIFMAEEIKDVLNSMYDFERIVSKIIYKTANCRDLIALKNSIENLPLLKKILSRAKSSYLKEIYDELDTLENIFKLIDVSIVDEPPFSIREGGMIKEGFHPDLDTLLVAKTEGKTWLEEFENKEKESTGIKNLRVRYNKVFGYYIEVTKSNISSVPDYYVRKQTLTNCERYTTKELDELAGVLLGAEERMVELETELFFEIINSIAAETVRIQSTAFLCAITDTLQSLAEAARSLNYVKPEITTDGIIDIKDGRHPVVEKMLDSSFIPNDTFLDTDENLLSIITGPNMAGKSTYMRQTALIVLMAQIGSFVPASFAKIGIVDRIFTRVGASDDLASGQSTFMVEMAEVANILNNATKDSLLILDEIGRGTSTFDGLSIAWSVLEYIADKKQVGAKTLFATHYHEISELEGKLKGVKNYCITVKEQGDDVVFLRKIVRGGADHSYGVQVAKLAGLPNKVISRAKAILKQLNAADITKKAKHIASESQANAEEAAKQMDMFTMNETHIIDEINRINVMNLTPIEALQVLYDLQNKTKGM